ncbi:hypothetical protein [Deinococcus sonorensis]|uniref:Uncharacterized protein n=2 Tax=Deinococcus sonorensis TaxID=309891 RepID=A0AAU7UBE8_9DEIO
MYTLYEAQELPEPLVGTETRWLARHAGELAAGFVIPSTFEEGYYRQNNLPEQLRRLFAPVQPQRIDEDLLEPLCHQAAQLVRTSALLDDDVQLLFRALHHAELDRGPVHLRRPGQRRGEQALARPPGHEVLHALKRLWAADWSFEAVLERLDHAGSVGLEALPVLVLAGPPGQPDPLRALELGLAQAWSNPQGLVGLDVG